MSQSERHGLAQLRVVFVVGILCCSLLAGAGLTTASASDVYVTVSDVTVSNDEPTTGEAVTVTPTVSLSGQKDGGFEVTQVILTAPDQGELTKRAISASSHPVKVSISRFRRRSTLQAKSA